MFACTHIQRARAHIYAGLLSEIVFFNQSGFLSVFQAPAPDHKKIPQKDIMDVTVILLTCHYKEKEFIRVGYYVNNFCNDESFRNGNTNAEGKLTKVPPIEFISRNIAASQPRVTRFDIPWDSDPKEQKIIMDENSGMTDEGSKLSYGEDLKQEMDSPGSAMEED